MLARRGEDPATETEIAQAVQALLDKAEEGPVHVAGQEGPAGRRPDPGCCRQSPVLADSTAIRT